MKILITGSNGMLAKAVIKKFENGNELICTDVNELDITDTEEVLKFVSNIKPDYIINCAAYTAVDNTENNFELADKINGDGPKNLAIAANNIDCTLIHISTDYVFSGDLDTNLEYLETDKTNPVTAYGITKLHGEKNIQRNCSKYYIFRTAWLYGEGKNFVRTMLKLGNEKGSINVVNDQYGSPTYTVDLANIIYEAIFKKIHYGIYHSTSEGFTTWYELTKKIFELSNISCKVIPVTSEQFVSVAKRPKNSKLSKDKLKNERIEIPKWEISLNEYLKIEKGEFL